MRIGELARITKTKTETIRFYEKEGLLPPASRTSSNYRSYGREHGQRLSFTLIGPQGGDCTAEVMIGG